eukprot:CAMPEP_0196761698 /NCGR_PEP_ID=MMETSP1095-20130614/1002_1 /TAXON_ID=96789 ORGANISM="Chromulina nebulosa, Strain UTEXLB2642" /NCGR_SAMPLE_ID=MMETSP1095 /ASSEMBLY_ACC=CAM_ASM_000446 /LENGTH=1008 /DNA_ID=CAMNT_0042111583 /DNA_START=472 /DNA_END=3501 /DNA_ORIENTATION=-
MTWTTPNIDSLVSEGVSFKNYFTHESSLPSRGALLTGRYPMRLGLWNSGITDAELPLSEYTIGSELQTLGYKTYMIGKWSLGKSTVYHNPINRGFDYFYGFLSDSIDYYTKNAGNYYDLYEGLDLVSNEDEKDESVHSAFLFQSKAQKIIEDHANNNPDDPMFLLYSMQLMGSYGNKYSAPDIYLSRCDVPSGDSMAETEITNLQNYCALNLMLDEAIGNLTCALSANGFHDNTILIVTSDNGGSSNIEGSNYPYHGNMGDHSRGGVSVNAFIHSKLIPSGLLGQVYNGLMHVTDWYPTIMQVASGLQWTGPISGNDIDGLNMWTAITTLGDSPRSEIIHTINDDEISVQIGSLKYDRGIPVHSSVPQFTFEEDLNPTYSNLVCQSPSLVTDQDTDSTDDYLSDENALYDLSTDPYELTDVLDESTYSDTYEYLLERAQVWQTLVTDPTSPSDTGKHKSWKACGGICPWLTDDSTTTTTIEQKYFYEDAPNIIFTLVDDWGYNDVGYRSSYMDWTTPTIDRLASEGVTLDNYFTYYSCVPSRGAFLTGRYSIRLGLWQARESAELPLTETTIAQEMQSAGYRTYMVGKWHMGFSTTSHLPSSRGFDYYYGYLNGFVDYWTKEYGGYLDLHENTELVTDDDEISSDYHNGYLLQSKAEYAIADHATNYPNQPMFMYYAMQLIHGVWSAPDEFLDRCGYPDTTDEISGYLSDVMGNYCALNVMLDEAITNLTCTLESYGMADNTVLIIVSDNGGESTVPGNNSPFRGAKGSFSRGGVSVNGLIHSKYIPDSMKGQSYEGQMHITDWLPTLMGLATNGEWTGSYSGADIDGVDMWDAIMTNSESPHEEIVHYANGDESISIQYNMVKLDKAIIPPGYTTPLYTFDEDNAPENSLYECNDPSLIYDTLDQSRHPRGATKNEAIYYTTETMTQSTLVGYMYNKIGESAIIVAFIGIFMLASILYVQRVHFLKNTVVSDVVERYQTFDEEEDSFLLPNSTTTLKMPKLDNVAAL